MNSARRLLISTMGSLVGLAGIEHGIGEVLQGNVSPTGLFILSWPEAEFFASLGGEPALTIIPNLLATGILAILVSLGYLVWATLLVDRRRAGWVLVMLCAPMLLFGGGLFPPVLGLLIGVGATRLHAPLNGLRQRLPTGLLRQTGALFPWSFGACVIAWLAMFLGIGVLSCCFGFHSDALIWALLGCMFGLLFLSTVTAFARDSRGLIGKGC